MTPLLLAEYAPRAFFNPMRLPEHWNLLIIPLAIGIAIIYKSVRCKEMREVPKESAKTTLFILVAIFACQYAFIGWHAVMK
jgi:hypothetical protein